MKAFENEDTYAHHNFSDFIKSKREVSKSLVLYLDEQLIDVEHLQNTLNIHITKHNYLTFSKSYLYDCTLLFLVYKSGRDNAVVEYLYSLAKDELFVLPIIVTEEGSQESTFKPFNSSINITYEQLLQNQSSIHNIINAVWSSMFDYTLADSFKAYDSYNEIIAEYADVMALLGSAGVVSYHLVDSTNNLNSITQRVSDISSKINTKVSNYVCIIFEHNNEELLQKLLYICDNIIEPFYDVLDDGNGLMYYTYPNKKLISGCIKVHLFINELD